MSFDWQAFLDQRGIDYAERGPSTSRGNLYVHCPFCGDADQGRHMGISTENRGWGCWRNQAHRGKNPQRLIQALLGCSWAEAGRLAGKAKGGSLWGADDAVGQMLAGFEPAPESIVSPLDLPNDFKAWNKKVPAVIELYLMDRGYDKKGIKAIVEHYQLYWALTGAQAYRIIFPIYDENNALVTWTGRTVGDGVPKYKTLSVRQAGRPSLYGPEAYGPITDYLLDLRTIAQGGHILVVTEGPFDAVNLWLHATRAHLRLNVTCLFGKVVSDAQLDRLASLRDSYEAVFLLLDPEASLDALELAGTLATAGVRPFYQKGEHDPGEMTPDEIDRLFWEMANEASSFANGKKKA